MNKTSCMYCDKTEALDKLMLPVCEVDGYPLYLLRNQSYLGRMILSFDDHITKIPNMNVTKCAEFFLVVQKVTKVIMEMFEPGQINIGMYGDKVSHLHCHIVPKYEGGLDWGSSFQLNPESEKILSDIEYSDMIKKIIIALN